MATTSVHTKIPSGVDEAALIQILHSHKNIIDALAPGNSAAGKLEIKSKWRVANGQLTEDVEIDGNFMTKR